MDPRPANRGGDRVLVIGGAGMLGREIVARLAETGAAIRVLDLDAVRIAGVESMQGDIRDASVLDRAMSGVTTVHQTAAAVWDPALPESTYQAVNVVGNRLVIEACRLHGVRKLIYTSSMDVVVDGRVPIVDGDERLSYPERAQRDAYSRSKIDAERTVLAANGESLATCALRPAGMYGRRDRYHFPAMIRQAEQGPNIRLGSGRARFSHVYAENVAHAHLLAAEQLSPGSPIAGHAYFITDHKPDENLFTFFAPFLEALGLTPPRFSIPYPIAYVAGMISELVAPRSPFNRFSVVQTCVDHTFVHDAATRDFGYEPVVSREEAFRRTIAWFRAQRAGRRERPESAPPGGRRPPGGSVDDPA